MILLLGLAALNRFICTPAVVADYENTRPCWDRSCWNAFSSLASLPWSPAGAFTPPPRASAASRCGAALGPYPHGCARCFRCWLSPGKVGSNDFVLQLMTGDAALLPAKEATLILSLPERGIEPMERRADARTGRLLARARRRAAAAGRWRMQIDALVHGLPEDHAAR